MSGKQVLRAAVEMCGQLITYFRVAFLLCLKTSPGRAKPFKPVMNMSFTRMLILRWRQSNSFSFEWFQIRARLLNKGKRHRKRQLRNDLFIAPKEQFMQFNLEIDISVINAERKLFSLSNYHRQDSLVPACVRGLLN